MASTMDQEDYINSGPSQGRPFVPFPSAATSSSATPLPPGTPNTDRSRADPFGEVGDGSSTHHRRTSSKGPANPFSTPGISRPASSLGSLSAQGYRGEDKSHRFFHSRRVQKGEVEKPWLENKNPKEKWVTILPLIGILIGLGLSGFLIWDGLRSVVHHNYCPVMDEDFSGGLDSNIWTKEVEVGGFGNGEFSMATGGEENVFVEDGRLVIKATLQDAEKVEKDNVMDLIKDGSCTSDKYKSCVAATNTTAGNATIVPPTKSGRINTKKGASIKYGRVEVTAKLPKGDWLWPAIWMMPVKDTYGVWPASGEIDIMESRGNNWTYAQGGNNIMSSALHWGPDPANDAWWKTNNKNQALHTTFSSGYNTFGLEWSQKYLFTYVNSRLMQVMYVNFNKPMWARQAFSETTTNGSRIIDTWSQTGNKNTPFDQKFYLILNLAVGGTNGWFEDGKSGKPWLDQSPNAKKDFWNARDTWLATWDRPQMEIKRVVMLQQCDGDEEL